MWRPSPWWMVWRRSLGRSQGLDEGLSAGPSGGTSETPQDVSPSETVAVCHQGATSPGTDYANTLISDFQPQSCEEIKFQCLSCSVHGILLGCLSPDTACYGLNCVPQIFDIEVLTHYIIITVGSQQPGPNPIKQVSLRGRPEHRRAHGENHVKTGATTLHSRSEGRREHSLPQSAGQRAPPTPGAQTLASGLERTRFCCLSRLFVALFVALFMLNA